MIGFKLKFREDIYVSISKRSIWQASPDFWKASLVWNRSKSPRQRLGGTPPKQEPITPAQSEFKDLHPAPGMNYSVGHTEFQIPSFSNEGKCKMSHMKVSSVWMRIYNYFQKLPIENVYEVVNSRKCLSPLRQYFFQSILDSTQRIPDSRYWISAFFSGTGIVDTNRQWDSRTLELYSGFESPGFRTPQAKFSPILKSFTDMGWCLPVSWRELWA